jgi:hypothetical protein
MGNRVIVTVPRLLIVNLSSEVKRMTHFRKMVPWFLCVGLLIVVVNSWRSTSQQQATRWIQERGGEVTYRGSHVVGIRMPWSRVGVIPSLSSLTRLEVLDLSGNPFRGEADLSGLTRLKELDLLGGRIRDLTLLADLKQLESLNLSGTLVEDVTPLAQMDKLEDLGLSASRIEDISAIAELENLKSLDLWGTQIEHVEALTKLTNLKTLHLRDTAVTDLSPLSHLKALETLDLQETKVRDLSPIASLTNLTRLKLGKSTVEDLQPLSSLPKLRSLDLSHTSVTDLAPLSGLGALTSLDLTSTNIADLSPLVWFVKSQASESAIDGREGPDSSVRPANLGGAPSEFAGIDRPGSLVKSQESPRAGSVSQSIGRSHSVGQPHEPRGTVVVGNPGKRLVTARGHERAQGADSLCNGCRRCHATVRPATAQNVAPWVHAGQRRLDSR